MIRVRSARRTPMLRLRGPDGSLDSKSGFVVCNMSCILRSSFMFSRSMWMYRSAECVDLARGAGRVDLTGVPP
jgi:hypothetical protein